MGGPLPICMIYKVMECVTGIGDSHFSAVRYMIRWEKRATLYMIRSLIYIFCRKKETEKKLKFHLKILVLNIL